MPTNQPPINLNRLAIALEKNGYTAAEISQAANITPRIAGLHFLLKDIGCSPEEARKALACKEAKIQIKDRLIGMFVGWNENPIMVRENVVKISEQITRWLFEKDLIDMDHLIAAGPYYPSQPESRTT